ncbi:MAG TPA: GGDEF domain-containing protein, partial [Magnetovibrio sp.]
VKECSSCDGQRTAIRKLLMFDMQLVFDTYISTLVAEVETAKTELEEYAQGLETVVAERTNQLQEMATRDALTGLFNQRGFHEHLRREAAVAERGGSVLSLLYFDLNGFKKLNDTKGHKEGDKLLTWVGKATQSAVRDVDFGCRYGGDEFCIIMPRTTVEQASAVYDRLIATYDAGETYGVTFSAGLAHMGPNTFPHPDSLIKIADTTMYKAKAKAKKKPGHYLEVAK